MRKVSFIFVAVGHIFCDRVHAANNRCRSLDVGVVESRRFAPAEQRSTPDIATDTGDKLVSQRTTLLPLNVRAAVLFIAYKLLPTKANSEKIKIKVALRKPHLLR